MKWSLRKSKVTSVARSVLPYSEEVKNSNSFRYPASYGNVTMHGLLLLRFIAISLSLCKGVLCSCDQPKSIWLRIRFLICATVILISRFLLMSFAANQAVSHILSNKTTQHCCGFYFFSQFYKAFAPLFWRQRTHRISLWCGIVLNLCSSELFCARTNNYRSLQNGNQHLD